MIKKLISTAIVSSVIGSASANPELGYMRLGTDQYQLFNATIAIDALPSELANKKLKVKLGSITDFYRHNIEYDKQVSSLRFKVARDSDGKPLIRVRSVREITTSNLKAVVKLTVGNQKIYGIYDFKLTPNKERRVTLNLLNTDHKPADKPLISKKAQEPSTSTARIPPSTVKPLPAVTSPPTSHVKDVKDIGTSSFGQYQVKTGQSISGIAMELVSMYPDISSWRTLMTRLAALNPDAFINGDINKLRADAQLKLPGSVQQIAPVKSPDKSVIAHSENKKSPSNTLRSNALNSTIIIKDLPEGLAGKDNLKVQLASITDYYRQGVDYNQQVAGLRFDITTNSRKETVIRARSTREISAKQLTAVVKLSAGRKKAYGIYELRSSKSGQHIAFNLLDINGGKKPQVVQSPPSSRASGDIAKKQALEALQNKLKGYEQAQSHNNKVSTKKPVTKDLSSSQTSGDVAKKQALEALRKKLKRYEQERSQDPIEKSVNKVASSSQTSGDVAKKQALEALRKTLKGYEQAKNMEAKSRQSEAKNQGLSGKTAGRGSGFSSMAAQDTYQVSKGDTISTIAMKLSKAYPGSKGWRGAMKLLVKHNPDAFINGDINKIHAGTVLKLPESSDYDHLYKVVAGDNVSTIAWRMQYKYPQPTGWKGMMKQIVHMNPKAFTNGNPNKLRENEILIIPDSGASEIEAEIQELPQEQPEIQKSNSYNHSKLQKMRHKSAKLTQKNPSSSKDQPVQQKAEAVHKVTESESLAAIAHKLIPDYPQFDSWYDLLQELAKLNPSLFMNNDIGAIRRGTVLQLPEKKPHKDKIDTTSVQSLPAERNSGKRSSVRRPESTTDDVTALSYNKISNSLLSRIGKTPVYNVPEGYTISMVAIKLLPQFPEYESWTALMRVIYKLNPDAFIDRDINQLRTNSRLKLPNNVSS